jgi:hypothetical protein
MCLIDGKDISLIASVIRFMIRDPSLAAEQGRGNMHNISGKRLRKKCMIILGGKGVMGGGRRVSLEFGAKREGITH